MITTQTKLNKYFEMAIEASLSCHDNDMRAHFLGAVGVRADGAIVSARNGSNAIRFPAIHAEARLAKKLDRNSVVYVARVTKGGNIGLAKPCPTCEAFLRNKNVKKVFYTIDAFTYGTLNL
jgi:hypothetical protein